MDLFQDLGRLLTFPIDFEGQKRAESISNKALYLNTVVSAVAGFVTQSLKVTGIVFLTGVVLVMAAVLPAYNIYNKNRPQWARADSTVIELK